MLVVCARPPARGCSPSELLLARLSPNAIIELVNGSAWARALGYTPHELNGNTLRALMPLQGRAADRVVAALLDTGAAEPLDVPLRCKDGRRKCLRLHRRFDPHDGGVFLVAEELSAAGG